LFSRANNIFCWDAIRDNNIATVVTGRSHTYTPTLLEFTRFCSATPCPLPVEWSYIRVPIRKYTYKHRPVGVYIIKCVWSIQFGNRAHGLLLFVLGPWFITVYFKGENVRIYVYIFFLSADLREKHMYYILYSTIIYYTLGMLATTILCNQRTKYQLLASTYHPARTRMPCYTNKMYVLTYFCVPARTGTVVLQPTAYWINKCTFNID
jgi:hypothetical protein